MLHNVIVDVVGNCSLAFVWEGDQFSDVRWTLLGEDPISGQPFIVCGGPCDRLEDAAREAWRTITSGHWFDIRPALEGMPSITSVWRRAFGSSFYDVIEFIKTEKGEVPGVAYIKYNDRREQHGVNTDQA